ncbi:MAG: hypothetical protein B1H40_01530 [Candidatus Latescibacteria bacterium 4484_181]|nr:MAG: hypothetical protein B1H40_01530 [Candidatus Latescibacteria bacterium 4484_181]RKY68182.1 MAG: hypothetical protein DRQ02_05035 [Candidatus Latescibacterota bacterium]RKY71763.1 MAG: hypothetical protein DRQ24_06635 [Candidatus Latescibacterota bacterium]
MPLGNGTGPMGLGPMTGRAAGYCAGYPVPGFMNPYGGRLGLGWRPGYPVGWPAGPYPGWAAYPGYGVLAWRWGGRGFWGLGRPHLGLAFRRGRGRWW